jgi:hypothetical protein
VEEPGADEAVAGPWAFCEEVAAAPALEPPQPAQYINDAKMKPNTIVRIATLSIQAPCGSGMNREYKAVDLHGIGGYL